MTDQADYEAAVQALLQLTEGELELELGRRLSQTADEVSKGQALTVATAAGPTIDTAHLASASDFLGAVASRFLKRFNTQMYSLVCDVSDPDNAKIRVAAGQGAEALGYVLGGVLVATFGWLPGIATVIAVIVAKRAGGAGYAAFCETWKEQL